MALAAESSRVPKIPESVLVVIYTEQLQVLLLERADRPGFWQSVTGSKNDAMEMPQATAIREVAEETGIVVGVTVPDASLRDWHVTNVFEIYPIWQARYATGVTHNTEHVFSLKVPTGINIRLSAVEHLQYCWMPYEEAAKRCFSASNAEAILQLPQNL